MPPTLIIGLTGNIATGKSTVARLLAGLGADVIDADRVAHEVMTPGEPAYSAVVAAFGSQIAPNGGAIDRRRLGEIVFDDPQALARLEALVHPAVGQRIAELVARSTADVVVMEAIKLLEAGLSRRLCDTIWVVTAPRAVQISRLMETRSLSYDEAVARIDAQPPQEAKVAQADVVIANEGDLDALRRAVEAAWQATTAADGRVAARASNSKQKTL